MRRNINEKVLRSLKPPAKGRLVVRDRTLPGLRIRVTPRGVKTWSVVYKMAGERTSKITGLPRTGSQKRITLGRYPAMGLSEAQQRKVVSDSKIGLGFGVNPGGKVEPLSGIWLQ